MARKSRSSVHDRPGITAGFTGERFVSPADAEQQSASKIHELDTVLDADHEQSVEDLKQTNEILRKQVDDLKRKLVAAGFVFDNFLRAVSGPQDDVTKNRHAVIVLSDLRQHTAKVEKQLYHAEQKLHGLESMLSVRVLLKTKRQWDRLPLVKRLLKATIRLLT